MAIWFKPMTLADLKLHPARGGAKGGASGLPSTAPLTAGPLGLVLEPLTMIDHLGIEITELGDDFLAGTMPVDGRTRQPYGLLHGGASAALAETLASLGANLVVDPAAGQCVGLELNANHIGACRDGFVTGRSTPLHLGRTTQVWETRITQGTKLICASRLTLAVLKR